jgi:hypothetical protein
MIKNMLSKLMISFTSGVFFAGIMIFVACNEKPPVAPVTYQLTVIAGTGGSIVAPTGSPVTVNPGGATTITAHANPGYHFAAWTVMSGSASLTYGNAATTTVRLTSGSDTVRADFVAVTSALAPISLSAFQTEQGINYSYYKGVWTTLPDFSALTPDSSGSCDNFDVQAIQHQSNNFGIVFDGYLNIPMDGSYTFYLNSADGGQLLLNDSVIINNDGLHSSPVENSATVALSQGDYLIEVRYFDASASPALSVSYESSDVGFSKTTISSGVLSRPYTGPVSKIIITKPAGGETYHLGDTIKVRWIYRNFQYNVTGQVFAQLSVNNGVTYSLINTGAFAHADTNGYYDWQIPPGADSLITQTARIKVLDYTPGTNFCISKAFSIAAP